MTSREVSLAGLGETIEPRRDRAQGRFLGRAQLSARGPRAARRVAAGACDVGLVMTAGDPSARHRQAVANTLAWADEAAQSGQYSDALSWLSTIESIGEELPVEYRAKRSAWAAEHPEPEPGS